MKQDGEKDKTSAECGGQNVSGLGSCNNTPGGIYAMPNFNINYKYLSSQQGNNLTITLAPSTVLNAKWG